MASLPRRRRSVAHAREPAPPVPASEPVEPAPPVTPAAVPAFPPALFEQLVHRVATEVTKQLQPPSSSPAVQEPRVASRASAALPSFAGTAAIQQLTTEIPVVDSSAVDPVVPSVSVGNAAAVHHVAQVVQSVHSTLAGEEPSPGAVQLKEVFTSINLPVDARVPLKLKTKIWQNEFIDFGLLLATNFLRANTSLLLILVMDLHPLWLWSPLLNQRKLCRSIVGYRLSMCLQGFILAAFHVMVPAS